ncbi:hypothetical protein N9L47_09980 [Rhodobacteraceae bacterium]|nr:hypothetical protein [Paracoccaceae bacterium]
MTENNDSKGLIRDSYRIEGINAPECRSIFLDWAISVPVGVEPSDWITALLAKHGEAHPDHPMTGVLREALRPPERTGRRGGAGARRQSGDA